MFSTPETSVHVLDKNREISPLEREEGYGVKDLNSINKIFRIYLEYSNNAPSHVMHTKLRA